MIANIIKASGGVTPSVGDNWVFENELTLSTTNIGEITICSACYANGIYLAAGTSGKCAYSYDGETWKVNTNFTTIFGTIYKVYSIIYANNMFMAVGDGGRCVTSPDGITWTLKGIIASGQVIYSVTYGNGLFIAVGAYGALATSSDGTVWTNNNTLTYIFGTGNINSITYADGKFIAVGDLGRGAISTNGIDWSIIDLSNNKFYYDGKVSKIKFLNGKYFAVGNNSIGLTSLDGVTWKRIPMLQSCFNDYYIGDITYDNGIYIAVGYQKIAVSNDGEFWVSRTAPVGMGALNSITYGKNTFVAVGDDGKSVYSIDNGMTWYAINATLVTTFKSVIFDGTNFIAVGLNNIMQTLNPNVSYAWQTLTTTFLPGGTSWNINDILYNNGLYIAVCNMGKVATSTDFKNWNMNTLGTGYDLTSVHYFNSVYYITGAAGIIFKSNDAITWDSTSVYTLLERIGIVLTDMCYSGTKIIAINENGMAVSSTDGINWNQCTDLTDDIFGNFDTTYLKFINNKYVALATNSYTKLAFSDDGLNWVKSYNFNILADRAITSIDYGNGKYVAVGQNNICLTSTDGITWTSQTGLNTAMSSVLYTFNDIVFSNGLFVAVSTTGKIVTSTDGITWTLRTSNITSDLYKIIYANGKFVVTGHSGSVYSTDGTTWNVSSSYSATWGSNVVYCLTYIDGLFYSAGNAGYCVTSTDGITWTLNAALLGLSTSSIRTIFKYNSKIYVINNSGLYLVGPNPNSWTTGFVMNDFTTTAAFYTSLTTNDKTIVAGQNSAMIACLNNSNIWGEIYSLKYKESYLHYSNIVKYCNGKFVIGGDNCGYISSIDGINWDYSLNIRCIFGYSKSIKDITYFNNKYVVIGTNGGCVTSSNGIDWEFITSYAIALGSLNNVINTGYVMISDSNSLYVFSDFSKYIKTDNFSLSNWIYKDTLGWSNSKFNGNTINTICDNGNVIIVGGNNGKCAYSTDGINWVLNKQVLDLVGNNQITASIYSFEVFPSKFLLFSGNNNGGIVLSSLDGINWIKENSNLSSILSFYRIKKVIYVNGLYYAVGTGGKCVTSPDGITWATISNLNTVFGASAIYNIIYANGKFLVVGQSAKCAYSTDGITWTLVTNLNTAYGTTTILDIEYGNGKFIVVGASGKCAYSTDGITWVKVDGIVSIFGSSNICSIMFDGTKFIVVGAIGKYAYSYDGISWFTNTNYTSISAIKNYWIIYKAIINNKNIYLSGGDSGYLLESFGQ